MTPSGRWAVSWRSSGGLNTRYCYDLTEVVALIIPIMRDGIGVEIQPEVCP